MTRLWKPQWLSAIAILSLLLGLLAVATAPNTAAQASLQDLSGAPVDIHSGTCDDFTQEPAYDGGDLEMQSLSDLRDSDDFDDSGLLESNGALGVDVNGDGTLQDSETIGATDTDATAGVAQASFDEENVDVSNPFVAVLHAGADQYDTALACGSINDAVTDDDGNLIPKLHPVDNSGLFGYSILPDDGSSINSYIFEQGSAPAAASTPAGQGYPVGIHRGTCTDWTVEPAYDVGVMQLTNVAAPNEQDVGDTSAELPEAASQLGDVYEVDTETEFGGDDLIGDNGPYVVAVHQDAEDNYNTLVACGNVFDIPENDSLVVPLQPVGDSNWTGVTLIGTADDTLAGFLWQCEPLEQQVIPTPTPAPTTTPTPVPTETPQPTNTPTPVPTNTPVPTAVIEQTQVVPSTEVVEVTATKVVESTEVTSSTEVVLAPTATALANEGGSAPTPTQTPEG